MCNGYCLKLFGGKEVQINDQKYNTSPGIQKVLVDSSYNTSKSVNGMDKVVSRDMLQKTNSYNRKPFKRRTSGRDKFFKKQS